MAVAQESDPALHFDRVVLPAIHAPAIADRLSGSEQETLLAAGVTPLEVDNSGSVAIVRLVTTRTSYNGTATLRLMDTTPIAILDYYRESCAARVSQKFPRPKLNERMIDAINLEHFDVAKLLEGREILQNVDDYQDEFVGEIDSEVPGRARFRIPAPVVQGLHQMFNIIDLIYR
jgi:phage tail sheath gpL-like